MSSKIKCKLSCDLDVRGQKIMQSYLRGDIRALLEGILVNTSLDKLFFLLQNLVT